MLPRHACHHCATRHDKVTVRDAPLSGGRAEPRRRRSADRVISAACPTRPGSDRRDWMSRPKSALRIPSQACATGGRSGRSDAAQRRRSCSLDVRSMAGLLHAGIVAQLLGGEEGWFRAEHSVTGAGRTPTLCVDLGDDRRRDLGCRGVGGRGWPGRRRRRWVDQVDLSAAKHAVDSVEESLLVGIDHAHQAWR